jgi:drug/metabolite transporter, DME family
LIALAGSTILSMNPGTDANPILGVMLVLGAATLWGTTGTAQSLADGSLSA